MVIQSVTGNHASVAVRQGILDPLEMTHTYYQVYEGDGSALAHGIHIDDGEYEDTHPWISNFALGCAPIASTAADIGRFYRAIFKDSRLLSKKARKEMLEKNLVDIGESLDKYGFGIVKTDWGKIVSYWHNGGIEGYRAIVRYFPEHDLVVAGFVNLTIGAVCGVPFPQPAVMFETQVLSIVMARLSAREKTHPHE
jgi:CubicO group peptidase (beta-lactamase class C family)